MQGPLRKDPTKISTEKTCRGFAQDHASASYRWFHQGPDNMFSQRPTCAKSSRTSCRHLTKDGYKILSQGPVRDHARKCHTSFLTCVTYYMCDLPLKISYMAMCGFVALHLEIAGKLRKSIRPWNSLHKLPQHRAARGTKVWTMWGCLRWALPATTLIVQESHRRPIGGGETVHWPSWAMQFFRCVSWNKLVGMKQPAEGRQKEPNMKHLN